MKKWARQRAGEPDTAALALSTKSVRCWFEPSLKTSRWWWGSSTFLPTRRLIKYGGAFFVYDDTNERMRDGVRMVQRVFQIVSGPVTVVDQLEQEF